MAGDTDLRLRRAAPRLAGIAVLLAEMDAVGTEPLGQAISSLTMKATSRSAHRRWSGSASRAASCWSMPLTRNWKAATGPASSASASRLGKSPPTSSGETR